MPTTLVQSKGLSSGATNTPLTFDSPTTSGNLIVVCISNYNGAAPTISDNKGNTYQLAKKQGDGAGAETAVRIFYAEGAAGGSSHTITVNSPGNYQEVGIAEFSGVKSSGSLDGTAGATGSGTSVSSGNMTVSQAETLLIGCMAHTGSSNTISPGSGFTAIYNDGSNATSQPIGSEYQTGVAADAAATFDMSSGPGWVCAGAAFKPAGGPPADPSNLAMSAATGGLDATWDDNASDEDGFTLEIDTVDTFDSADLQTVTILTADGESTQVLNLESGTYYGRVRSYNSNGSSGWSNTASTSVVVAPDTPANVTIRSTGPTSLRVAWVDPGAGGVSPAISFHVAYALDTGFTISPAEAVGVTDLFYDITGLTPGVPIYVKVLAVNDAGLSDFSGVVSAVPSSVKRSLRGRSDRSRMAERS